MKMGFIAYSVGLIFLLSTGIFACQKKSEKFFVGALGLQKDRVIIASQLATALTVSSYDLNGNLLGVLADYYGETNGPRGLAIYDALNFLVSLEGTDRLDLVYLGGGRSTFLSSSFLGGAGAMGKLVRHPTTNDLFIIDAVTSIERFDITGQRIPQSGNAFIQAALAPCAAPASLRAMVINSSGELVAIQSGVTGGFRLTIGPTVASACAAVTLASAANDIIKHSDGNLYYIGTNNQVYRTNQTLSSSTSIFNNSATINTPTAMAELPNGNLLIASDGTDSVEIITTSGTYVGSFAKDTNMQQVHSILVVPGQ